MGNLQPSRDPKSRRKSYLGNFDQKENLELLIKQNIQAAELAEAAKKRAKEALVDKDQIYFDVLEPEEILEAIFEPRGIPVVFRWDKGGDNVYLRGTFNKWASNIPMVRSGNNFVQVLELPRGQHQFKYSVDDQWRFYGENTMVDDFGNINNFLDLTKFKTEFEDVPEMSLEDLNSRRFVDSVFDSRIPGVELEEDERSAKQGKVPNRLHQNPSFLMNCCSKEPPMLPSLLQEELVSSLTPKSNTKSENTKLNHMHCMISQNNGLIGMATSQHYKEKVVNIVYFAPMTGGFSENVFAAQRKQNHA